MKWKEFDNLCNELARIILWIVVLIFLWSIAGKSIQGRYEFYEDYYNQKHPDLCPQLSPVSNT